MERTVTRLREIGANLDDAFFNPVPESKGLYATFLGLSVLVPLYILGILHWAFFFQFGEAAIDAGGNDWRDGLVYFSVVRDSIENLTIPYFVTPTPGNWGDVRFLANPQSTISPQMVLALFMSAGNFVLVNTLIMYSIGFIGCLLIRSRFNLSPLPFVLLFLIFNFNGHITAHLSVGHSMWYGYFFLPFFFLFVLELISPSDRTRILTAIFLAFPLFGIILQGSFHIFIWCSILLVILAFVDKDSRKMALLAILFAICLSAFRIFPTVLGRIDYTQVYASGFPTFSIFFDALTTIKAFQFEHPNSAAYNVGWHEHDHFIGYIGVGFIALFGIYHRFSNNSAVANLRFKALDLPLLLLVLMSFGFFFDIISDLKLPLLSYTERVPSRILIIPLIGLAVVGAIRMQALLYTYNRNLVFKALSVGAVIHLTHSLIVHSDFWKLPKDESGPVQFLDGINLNAPNVDSLYVAVVNGSGLFSLVAIAVLGFLAIRLFLNDHR